MTIAVTGANGFVGRAVLAALEQAGIESRPLVRRHCELPKETLVGDLSPGTNWLQALSGCDTVIHLAARVHVMSDRSQDPLAQFRSTNCAGTLRLADQAHQSGVKRLVFVSSVKVLGEFTLPGTSFQRDQQLNPADTYGMSKAEAETGLIRLAARTGLEVVIVRPPLVYGPGVGANFLQLMRWVARGVPLPLGAIFNQRTLVSVENLASLLLACATAPAAAGNIFHAGDGEDVSTTHLLQILSEGMGRKSRLVPVPATLLRVGLNLIGAQKIAQRLCDNLQLETASGWNKINWSPPVSLRLGLQRTAQHFMNSIEVK